MLRLTVFLTAFFCLGVSNKSTPKLQKVSLGMAHTCALFDNGRVKCWGTNGTGELGYGDTITRGSSREGTIDVDSSLPFIDLGDDFFVKNIVSREAYNCAVSATGMIKCWGLFASFDDKEFEMENGLFKAAIGDQPGEMGNALKVISVFGSLEETTEDISLGVGSVCAVSNKGRIKCWGGNSECKLGAGKSDAFIPFEKATPVNLPYKFVSVSAGASHTCGLSDEGKLYCFGAENSLALGRSASNGPCSGLGCSDESIASIKPVDFGTTSKIQSVSSYSSTCVTFEDKTAKCFGLNENGALGLGTTDPLVGDSENEIGIGMLGPNLGSSFGTFAKIEFGTHFACALSYLGSAVKCWGFGLYGKTGLGLSSDIGTRPEQMGDSLAFVDLGDVEVVKDIEVGADHACAVLLGPQSEPDRLRLKCWGANYEGQLGINSCSDIGDDDGEMGNALQEVNLY